MNLHQSELVAWEAAPTHQLLYVHVLIALDGMPQELMEEGAECWILYPGNGIRPVAEGIAGRAPTQHDPGRHIDNTYMKTLWEDGLQNVTVTRVYKKKVDLMYVDRTSARRFLDDMLIPPAPPGTMAKWSVRFLVPKEEGPP